jgi:hypothetical protein
VSRFLARIGIASGGPTFARSRGVSPSIWHEVLLLLSRNRPTLIVELLHDELGIDITYDSIRFGESNLTTALPTEYHADQVLVFEHEGRPRAACVLEAQRDRDDDKYFQWPAYLATLRSRLRCDVYLVVVTMSPSVARWAADSIPMGHPGLVLRPIVLGPAQIPRITNVAEAMQSPELAVLSVVAHADEEDAPVIAEAALLAARGLDQGRERIYDDLVRTVLPDGARAMLEAVMAAHGYQYPQSDFARKHYGEGLQQSLLVVISARGWTLDDAQRARITACTDMETLSRWLRRAVGAKSVDEVLTE